MAKNVYSEELMDAFIIGDMERIKELQEKIDAITIERIRQSKSPKVKRLDDHYIKVNNLLNNEDASARKIYDFLTKEYGKDWWEDEIETIERLIWMDFGISLSPTNLDKVLALRHLCRSDAAFFDWYEFNQLALAFGGTGADFLYLRKPTPGMLVNVVQTINYVRPDEESDFSKDVLNYICISLINDGIYTPPPTIAKLIGENMNDLVNEWSAGNWAKVGSELNSIVKDPSKAKKEDPATIQARRVLITELAAEKYFK